MMLMHSLPDASRIRELSLRNSTAPEILFSLQPMTQCPDRDKTDGNLLIMAHYINMHYQRNLCAHELHKYRRLSGRNILKTGIS